MIPEGISRTYPDPYPAIGNGTVRRLRSNTADTIRSGVFSGVTRVKAHGKVDPEGKNKGYEVIDVIKEDLKENPSLKKPPRMQPFSPTKNSRYCTNLPPVTIMVLPRREESSRLEPTQLYSIPEEPVQEEIFNAAEELNPLVRRVHSRFHAPRNELLAVRERRAEGTRGKVVRPGNGEMTEGRFKEEVEQEVSSQEEKLHERVKPNIVRRSDTARLMEAATKSVSIRLVSAVDE